MPWCCSQEEVLQGCRNHWNEQQGSSSLLSTFCAVNPILYPPCHIEGGINTVLR